MQQLIRTYERVLESQLKSGSSIENGIARTYIEHKDREEWMRHFRIALMGSWAIAVLIAAWAVSGCSHATMVQPARTQATGTASQKEQAQRAVRVERACLSGDPYKVPGPASYKNESGGWGSGVLSGPETVLTAWHVVKCPPRSVRIVWVVTPDEVKHWAQLGAGDPSHDVARLVVSDLTASKLEIVSPLVGDTVCIATAHPQRQLSCGVVYAISSFKTTTNGTVDVWHSARTIPGNSGAGVYNRRGQLVGLATNTTTDDSGGLATSVSGRVP